MPKALQDRNITLHYKPEEIGQKVIDYIESYYKRGIELHSILSLLNRRTEAVVPLNLADMYTILFVGFKADRVAQRKDHLIFELKLTQFAEVFQAWRKGYNVRDILEICEGSKEGITRAVKSIALRHRNERQQLGLSDDASAKELIAGAKPMTIQGRPCIVIYLDEIPADVLSKFSLENFGMPDVVIEEIPEETADEVPSPLPEKIIPGLLVPPVPRYTPPTLVDPEDDTERELIDPLSLKESEEKYEAWLEAEVVKPLQEQQAGDAEEKPEESENVSDKIGDLFK